MGAAKSRQNKAIKKTADLSVANAESKNAIGKKS